MWREYQLDKLNIQVITDGAASSASTTMIEIARYSKHNITHFQWNPNISLKPDLVYFHYGLIANNYIKLITEHPEIRWGAGALGPYCFNSMFTYDNGVKANVDKFAGFVGLGGVFQKMIRDITGDKVPVYDCDVGVDTDMFTRKPPPEEFSIGMILRVNNPRDDLVYKRFLSYPYPHYTCSAGLGTYRQLKDMPAFYESIAVHIDPTYNPRPGGLTFLESGAVGRPVICMKSGVTATWLPKEWLAVDDNDVLDMLVRLNDEDIYAKASEQFYQMAKSRDHAVIVSEYDYAFEQMMNND
jgi:hypothetical protein